MVGVSLELRSQQSPPYTLGISYGVLDEWHVLGSDPVIQRYEDSLLCDVFTVKWSKWSHPTNALLSSSLKQSLRC